MTGHVILNLSIKVRRNRLINGRVMSFCWCCKDGVGGRLVLSVQMGLLVIRIQLHCALRLLTEDSHEIVNFGGQFIPKVRYLSLKVFKCCSYQVLSFDMLF